MKTMDERYWDERYHTGQTGWDIGYASPAITDYFSGPVNRELRILIPGCGNAHEAVWLHRNGYTRVFLLDIASSPLENFRRQVPDFPESQLIHSDFFEHHGTYDLIIEQTFFCALDPGLRKDYVSKTAELLSPGGHLTGVLFNTVFEQEGPPFGGHREEYERLFEERYIIRRMEPCDSSIPPRAGRELFIELVRK